MYIWIIEQMIYSAGIKGSAAADDAMVFLAFFKEKLGDVGTVLAGYASNKGFFNFIFHHKIVKLHHSTDY
jgi:hypothetical protein